MVIKTPFSYCLTAQNTSAVAEALVSHFFTQGDVSMIPQNNSCKQAVPHGTAFPIKMPGIEPQALSGTFKTHSQTKALT
ncbi:MAG: hypothetical protein WA116_02335 [Anaerolineaceae bacterium]